MGKDSDGQMCMPGGCCKMCGAVMGLFVLIAGVVMLLAAMGNMSAMTAMEVAGVMFVLFGLGKIVHSMKMCPMCNGSK